MTLVNRAELLGLEEYEQVRDHFRRRVIEEKRKRRIALGDNMTALFENHDTVLFQIQEMLRTERITKESSIEHEIDTYNELVPGKNELSVTIMIEYPEPEERERMLAALAGVEAKFYVAVGGERFAFASRSRGERTDRTTAVHYAKAVLSDETCSAIRSGRADVKMGVDHDAYRVEVDLPSQTVASLAEDLAP